MEEGYRDESGLEEENGKSLEQSWKNKTGRRRKLKGLYMVPRAELRLGIVNLWTMKMGRPRTEFLLP